MATNATYTGRTESGRVDYGDHGFDGNYEKNVKYIYDRLIADGATADAANAMLANFLHETNNLKNVQEIGNAASGAGLAQWTGPRRVNFDDWMAKEGRSVNSIKDNMDFFFAESRNETGVAGKKKDDDKGTPEIKDTRHHWKGTSWDEFKKETGDDLTEKLIDSYFRPGEPHLSKRQSYYSQLTDGTISTNGKAYDGSALDSKINKEGQKPNGYQEENSSTQQKGFNWIQQPNKEKIDKLFNYLGDPISREGNYPKKVEPKKGGVREIPKNSIDITDDAYSGQANTKAIEPDDIKKASKRTAPSIYDDIMGSIDYGQLDSINQGIDDLPRNEDGSYNVKDGAYGNGQIVDGQFYPNETQDNSGKPAPFDEAGTLEDFERTSREGDDGVMEKIKRGEEQRRELERIADNPNATLTGVNENIDEENEAYDKMKSKGYPAGRPIDPKTGKVKDTREIASVDPKTGQIKLIGDDGGAFPVDSRGSQNGIFPREGNLKPNLLLEDDNLTDYDEWNRRVANKEGAWRDDVDRIANNQNAGLAGITENTDEEIAAMNSSQKINPKTGEADRSLPSRDLGKASSTNILDEVADMSPRKARKTIEASSLPAGLKSMVLHFVKEGENKSAGWIKQKRQDLDYALTANNQRDTQFLKNRNEGDFSSLDPKSGKVKMIADSKGAFPVGSKRSQDGIFPREGNLKPSLLPDDDMIMAADELEALEDADSKATLSQTMARNKAQTDIFNANRNGSKAVTSKTGGIVDGAGTKKPTTEASGGADATDYEKALDKASMAGKISEAAKFAANARKLGRNNATKPPEELTPRRTSLLDFEETNTDFTGINEDVTRGISQMRAMGLGSSQMNSLLRKSMSAKNAQVAGVNQSNRQGRAQVAGANAGIEANNNAASINAKAAHQNKLQQLAIMKGKADDSIYSSMFDNATNMFNYDTDNADKKLKAKQYKTQMDLRRQGLWAG